MEIIRAIDHFGLTVPDIDAATCFFVAAFDAQIVYDTHLKSDPPQTGEAAAAMLGLARDASVIAIRLLRLSTGASLELFEARNSHPSAPGGVGDFGLHHVAFYCDDIVRAISRATDAGAVALGGPNDLHGPEAGAGNRMNYVRTPWGMLIELISYPAGVANPAGVSRWTPAV